MTTPRLGHSSVVVQDTLYLLGHDDSPGIKTAEELNIGMGQKVWTKSFDLQSEMLEGCALKTAPEEIITIAGDGESTRKMFTYNIKTGDAIRYHNLPPTPV